MGHLLLWANTVQRIGEARPLLNSTASSRDAEGGPGDSSNITHLWFCAVQNRQGKWHTFLRIFKWSPKKKVFTEIETNFLSKFRWSQKKKGLRSFISMGPVKPIGPYHGSLQAHGPPKIHGPRSHCPPLSPPRRPWLQATCKQFRATRIQLQIAEVKSCCPVGLLKTDIYFWGFFCCCFVSCCWTGNCILLLTRCLELSKQHFFTFQNCSLNFKKNQAHKI